MVSATDESEISETRIIAMLRRFHRLGAVTRRHNKRLADELYSFIYLLILLTFYI